MENKEIFKKFRETRPAGSFAAPVESWKNTLVESLVFLFPFSFALDFKGQEGGSLEQALMAIVSVAIFLMIFLAGRLRATRGSGICIAWSFLVLMVGCFTAICYGVKLEFTMKMLLPYWLFVAGIWTGSVACNSLNAAWSLFFGMTAAGLVSLLFRYYYATQVRGLALEEMRYQILSPAIASLIAYVCASFCFSRKLNVSVLLTSMAITVMIGLSITRSFVITLIFAALGLPLLLWRLGRGNAFHSVYARWRKLGLLIALGGAIIGLGVAYWLRPDIFDSWEGRLYAHRTNTRSGEDVNYITRIAEVKGIWERVSGSPWSMIFGLGFGNTYQWSFDYSEEVRSVSAAMVYSFFVPLWTAGHSPFNYALFFGGIPGLVWQICMFLLPLSLGWRSIPLFRPVTNSRVLKLFSFSLLSVLLYLSQSITANPFAERLSAHYLGLSLGLLLGINKLLANR
jgi:hypothetical protein